MATFAASISFTVTGADEEAANATAKSIIETVIGEGQATEGWVLDIEMTEEDLDSLDEDDSDYSW